MSKSKSKSKSASNSEKKKSIEDTYQKLDPLEHVIKRPAMYIGGTKKSSHKMWIWSKSADSDIILKNISIVPGFYKICDEVIVNARDHSVKPEKKCTIIKITIDKKTGEITVWNNGTGIDVVEHRKHKTLVPSMLFGELRAGTNFDDDDKIERVTGGMNGLGAKLANIFSIKFVVETLDAERELKFHQEWRSNMSEADDAIITPAKNKKPYTQISFIPDFERFGLNGISPDMFNLLKRRAYDIAATTDAKVYFNDELIEQTNLQKYVELYFPTGTESESEICAKAFDIKSNPRWKIGVVFDKTGKLDHENISFVNGICTNMGGPHVDHVVSQIVSKIKEVVSKKLKGAKIKPSVIKENLIFFVDCIINKPEFSSQSKEQLKTPVKEFGSEYELTEAFWKAIQRTGVVDYIIAKAEHLINAGMGKTDGKKTNKIFVEKLADATLAGTKRSEECCLFLTEGDSAKNMAMSGFNIIGRERYGVFPLKGKLKNVNKMNTAADVEKLNDNKEIVAIKKILGLKNGVVYNSLKELRYGKLCILTDQDVDGFHIKGLVMNFIHTYWPSLIKYEGFITSFPTPYVKASKKSQVHSFYSIPEFEEWKKNNNDGKGWNIKFYKGLGTSTSKESQEYFKLFEENLLTYYCPKSDKTKSTKKKIEIEEVEFDSDSSDTDTDTETKTESDDLIEITPTYDPKFKDPTTESFSLTFDKKRADDRRVWMNLHEPESYLDTADKRIAYPDFFNKEMRSHAIYNASRAIPNIMDGFKPGQRKIYFGSVKKNIYGLKNEVRVAQLAPYVSENTDYHHGEASLIEAIIKMAQNYVGANNLNLLHPQGAFGSRSEGGDDAASPRYIHTFLEDIGKKIFIHDDFDILQQQIEDNKHIEPSFYAPIIPMILVNGVVGIGTGFSSTIHPCNPRDIIENIRRILRGDKTLKMYPWYRHFTGTVTKFLDPKTNQLDDKKFVIRAKYEIDGDVLHITDLPIGVWTEDYKTFLMKLIMNNGTKNKNKNKATPTPTKKAKATSAKKITTKKTIKRKTGKGSKATKRNTQKSRTAQIAKTNTIGSYIKDIDEKCTDVKIDITIIFHPGKLQKIKIDKLEKELKLSTTVKLSNMHLFNEKGKIIKYNSYGDILQNYSRVRLQMYQIRKDYLLGKWEKELDMLAWRIKFIEHVIDGKIIVFRDGKTKSRAQVISKLEELEFPKFSEDGKKTPNYYYTEIGLYKLTTEEVDKLKNELAEKKLQIKTLKGKSSSDLWTEELDEFVVAYDEWERTVDEAYAEELHNEKPKSKNPKRKVKTI